MSIPVSKKLNWTISSNQYTKDIAMDDVAMSLVQKYMDTVLIPADPAFYAAYPKISVYIVWKAKVLQNWKYLISTDVPDNYYYELTFNGDKNEWYLDAYARTTNVCITMTSGDSTSSDANDITAGVSKLVRGIRENVDRVNPMETASR